MRRRKVEQDRATPDMTPMLDIVFIMLIFFIVTTSFVKEEAIDWTQQSTSIEDIKDTKPLLVTIDEFGGVEILGRHIDISSLRDNVEAATTKKSYAAAIVNTHRDAATGILVQAVDQIRLAGISQVTVGKSR